MPSRDDEQGWRWYGPQSDGIPLPVGDFPGARALRGEDVRPGIEMLYTTDDGREIWTRVAASPLRGADGHITGAFVVITDIDELKQTASALRWSKHQLGAQVQERTYNLVCALQEQHKAEQARTELMRRVINTQEEERGRISRELHDNLGQHLTGVMLGLQALEMQIGAITGGNRKIEVPQLDKLRAQVDNLMRAAHEQARSLRPAELDAMGLEAALRQYIGDWSERTGVEADFQAFGWEERPSIEVETTLYRVVQEALTNVARHANASSVSVVIEHMPDMAMAIIEDNGDGFDTEEATKRLGVLGMKERLELVGGTLEIESIPGDGTTLFARIPLDSHEDQGEEVSASPSW